MIELVMVLEDLAELPRFPPPSGYSFRGFAKGDGELWARIETSAGEFASVELAIEHFRREFGGHQPELGKRCLFVQSDSGEPVGTAMAWYGSLLPGRPAGRLHWVGIRREHQGRGIGKSLVSRAMEVLSALHDRAYLTTQRSSLAAIKIYLDFGFVPYVSEEAQEEEWSEILRQLGFAGLDIRMRRSGG